MLLVIAIALIVLLIAVVPSVLLSNSKEITMENTAKNFALQLGSLVTLYVSLSALTVLLFNVITVQYPDATQGYWEYESATTGIRFGIALLIVFFPAYVMLTRFVNVIRRKEHGTYLVLTKWLIYLSLVVGGGVILGDLVAVINGFLNGELTIRFMLKALVMLVVVGVAFTYYLFDARGYWQTHEKESKQYAAGAALIVVAALVLGFMHTETPAQVREMKLDATQINDLTVIQSHINEYYYLNGALPGSLSAAYTGIEMPKAPEDRAPYTYKRTSDTKFELCASFVYPSSKTEQMQYAEPYYIDEAGIKNGNNWEHPAGEWCFERVMGTGSAPKPLQ